MTDEQYCIRSAFRGAVNVDPSDSIPEIVSKETASAVAAQLGVRLGVVADKVTDDGSVVKTNDEVN